MIRTIHYHNTETAQAVIKFEQDGLVYEDTFDLRKVVPGVEKAFDDMGIEFDEVHQNKVIEKLTANVALWFEQGVIKAPPPVEAPPEPPAPVETEVPVREDPAETAPKMSEEDDPASDGTDLSQPSEHGTGETSEPADQPE